MSTEAFVPALSSVIRPTSAAAVYAMLAGRRPVPLLVALGAAQRARDPRGPVRRARDVADRAGRTGLA